MTEKNNLSNFLLKNNRERPENIAMRVKHRGIWQTYTWRDYYTNVKYLSLGLVSRGLKAGDRVAIIGENAPEYYWAEVAAFSARAIGLGLYVDSRPEEIKYILQDSKSSFVFADDQEQVDKMLEIKEDLPFLVNIIYWDERGLWSYDDPQLMSFEELKTLGEKYEKDHPDFFEETIGKIENNDTCFLLYTSGTTGLPKGVMSTHQTIINGLESWMSRDPWKDGANYLSYISPAWITEQFMGVTGNLARGFIINFPEEPETVNENIREIGPYVLMFNPRLWESMTSIIQGKMLDSSPLKRLLYKLALPIGYRRVEHEHDKKRANIFWNSLFYLAYLAVFRPLLSKMGLLRTRYAYTGGGPLSPGNFKFLRAIGVNLKQTYGISEAGGISLHDDRDVQFETVGPLLPGVEVKITEEGEVAVKSNQLSKGYFGKPEETEKVFKEDGYYYTGDAAVLTEDNHLVFLDRVKDMKQLRTGDKFSPSYIEGWLKFSPFIRDVIVTGGPDRDYVGAIIQIDFDNVSRWAERNKILYTTFTDLSQKSGVYDLTRKEVENVNRVLPDKMRVKKYTHLYKEFDPDEEELTRTRKLRRAYVENKYGELIEGIYSDQAEIRMESEITYENGRKGKIKASLRVERVE